MSTRLELETKQRILLKDRKVKAIRFAVAPDRHRQSRMAFECNIYKTNGVTDEQPPLFSNAIKSTN